VPSLVKWAVDLFAALPVDEAVAQFIGLLNDEDPRVRWVAAVALVGLGRGNSDVAAALRASIQDADADVREAAAWALRQVERKLKEA
jgi:HEAT repeat protein